MNWKAFLQTLLTAAINAALGILVSKATGSPAAGVTTMGAGTAIAHALKSPFVK